MRAPAAAVLLAALAVAQGGAAAEPCPPLPPPSGRVVRVASEPELQAAISALSSGTTVLLADGVYDLTNTLVVGGGLSGVAVRGESGDRDRVVLRGRGMSNPGFGNVPHGFLVQDATDAWIADLTVRDVYYHAVQVQGERGASRLALYNLHLLDAGEQLVKGSTAGPPGPYADDGVVACSLLEYTDRARSDYTNGVDVLAGKGWRVRDNLFRNIRAPVGQLAGPAVLFWRNSLDTVVERNRFVDCDRAIALGLAPPDANSRDGERTYDHQGGMVRNNTIYRAASSPTGDVGITVNYARDFAIAHNTVLLQGTFPWAIEYRFQPSDGTVANNLTDGPILPRDGATAALLGNVTGAVPADFTGPSTGDLHLLPSASAAIDRAVTLAGVGDDLDGEPRPQGAAPDVGADEICVAPGDEVRSLRAVRSSPDVQLTWDALAGATAYNVWHVLAGGMIDEARLGGAGVGVAGCSQPRPAASPTCTDTDALGRAPALFYQVRSHCPGGSEGP